MHDIDRRIATVAARQHGLVVRDQIAALGASRAVVRRRVANGRLVTLGRGVLRVAGAPVTWESTVMAHVLAAGEGAVASHRTAAVLWALDGCRPGPPEVTVPRGVRYRPAEGRTHQSRDLHLVPVVRRRGIATTPVDRTLLDLGAVVPRWRLHLAVDDAHRRGLTDWEALAATLAAHARRGRPGVGPLRAILEEHAGELAVTESGFERLVVTRLGEAGLPRPVLQHEVTVAGKTYRIDLAYPDARLAIELDGTVHLRRDVWQADHERQNALMLAGWTVLRFTWRDYRARPGAIVRQVRAALRAAAA